MRKYLTAGMAVAGFMGLFAAQPVSAQEMSDNAVQTLMDYAWSLTPDRFTKPDGGVIEIDRNGRKSVEVPLDQARAVIKTGRLSAHAQTCDLKEEHAANYRVFMQRESDKKKWTEQQMLYMNQLHLVTVMLLTGKLKVVETEEGKAPEVVQDGGKTDAKSCTEEQKGKVRDAIMAILKAGPPPGGAANSAPAAKSAAGGAAPAATPASEKK